MKHYRCVVCKAKLERADLGRPRKTCSNACRMKSSRKRSKASVHFSSASAEWSTPQAFYRKLHREHRFNLDVCSTHENAKCLRHFTIADDGLKQAWTGRVWMNPPYGRAIGAWMRKAYQSSRTTAEAVVCLVPARPGSAWWHDYAAKGKITFVRGRLKFGGSKSGAPFDSAVVVFRNRKRVTKRGRYVR